MLQERGEAVAGGQSAELWEFLLEWHSLRDGVAGAPLELDQPLHLQSLEVAELKVALESRLGVEVPIENLLSGPTPAQLLEALDQLVSSGEAHTAVPMKQSPAAERGLDPHEPFPLTPIQQAYLVGRSGALELGRYSTHAYYEFDVPDADMPRLQDALRTVIERHGMLRAIVLPDGRQQVLESVEPYEIAFQDLTSLPAEERDARLEAVRDELGHQVLPSDRWPLFDIRASRMDERFTRIHISVDLLILDAQSIMLVLRDWANTYYGVTENGSDLVSFKDYLHARRDVEQSDAYERARTYWMDRLADLPPGPELPLARPPGESDCRYKRREVILDEETSAALNAYARELKVTPSAILATAFSEVLSVWSARSHFLLNLTVGDRLPLVPDVNDIAGDFTTSMPLEVDLRGAETFTEKAVRVQRRLAADLDNRLFPGVAVQRELARLRGASGLVAPVVFTSVAETALNDTETPLAKVFGNIPYGISQTPQVHLDHQAYQRAGRFELVFDAVEDLFPEGMLDAMLAGYETLLKRVTSGEDVVPAGELLPPAELSDRRGANETEVPIAERLIHAGIERWTAETPDAPAVLAGDRTVTYAELDARANQIAHRLQELGAEPNQLVAVVMEHGWEQVAAVLGIVRSGAAYLPVDARLPERRLAKLVERGECRIALTQSHVQEGLRLPDGVELLVVDDDDAWREVPDAPVSASVQPGDLAYVIFTSGSTGEPKGVMIEHRAASNTIDDCIGRFEVTERDRIFGISSLSFDLSVFDVFGALKAGAAIVLPEPTATRDPGRWAELVRQHGVSVWNSVPALLEMLVEYAAGRREVVGGSLRLAMLSGDWIPVELPDRLRELVPGCRVVGMGGATEASIWSVLHEIDTVDPGWTSIPYGTPMANQRLHVLDGNLEPRPVWVPGEICIAGVGLASGYWRDPEKTAERFVEHPVTGERLYRTGDLGRYLPGGEIEFLGREDHQVKVGGHRIELGDIEAALCEHRSIRSAVVTAPGERGHRRLVAYFVPTDSESLEACDLRGFLGDRLPEYMVPQTFMPLEALPLTSNGKIDRRALPEPAGADGSTADGDGSAEAELPPPSEETAEVEQLLADIWKEVLGLESVDRADDFFDLGGDSLQATRVIAKAGAAGWRLDADMFFRLAKLASVAAAATPEEISGVEQAPLVGEVPLTPSQSWFFDHEFSEADHWNGFWPLLVAEERLDPDLLSAALREVILHHDGLRVRLREESDGWHARVEDPRSITEAPFSFVDLSGLEEPERTEELEAICARTQASLDLAEGPVLRLTYFDLGPEEAGRLHLVSHWAVLDYYSSRVLFEDLWLAYGQLAAGDTPQLPPKTISIADFAARNQELAKGDEVRAELPIWTDARRRVAATVPTDHDLGPNDQTSTEQLLVMFGAEETEAIVQALPRTSGANVAEALIAAVARAVGRWSGTGATLVELEAYGRWSEVLGIDVSRTVGRLSTFTPLLVEAPAFDDPAAVLTSVVDQIRDHPNHGIGHGLLRFMGDPDTQRALAEMPPPPINVNYWGQTNEYLEQAVMPFDESPGPLYAASGRRPRLLDVFGLVVGSQLSIVWSYSRNLHRQETMAALAEDAAKELLWLAGVDPATADVEAEPLEKSVLHKSAHG